MFDCYYCIDFEKTKQKKRNRRNNGTLYLITLSHSILVVKAFILKLVLGLLQFSLFAHAFGWRLVASIYENSVLTEQACELPDLHTAHVSINAFKFI